LPAAAQAEQTARWRAAVLLSTLTLSLAVAGVVRREPADFITAPVVAVLQDAERNVVWSIRLAPAAHLIAADTMRAPPPTADRAYQLWLISAAGKPRPLGLLPQSGRKEIAIVPSDTFRFRIPGELIVSVEPAGGALQASPSGVIIFRGVLGGAG